MNQMLVNLNTKPKKSSADTIYLTLANIEYHDNLRISDLIPTSQKNRKNSDNLPDNPFAIDYFIFDEYKIVSFVQIMKNLPFMEHILLHKKKEGEIKSNWSIPTIEPAKTANIKENVTNQTMNNNKIHSRSYIQS